MNAPAPQRVLGIFAKRPVSGEVKTRLAEGWGADAAAALYEGFLLDTLAKFRTTGDRRVLYYAPDNAESERCFREVAGGEYELVPQPEGDLGGRLAAFFSGQLTAAGSQAVAIGSDSPTLPKRYVEQAFASLDAGTDCVLGPAMDGGYYLIGLSRFDDRLFQEIDWSGPQTFAQQLRRVSECGFSARALRPWYDVDTALDVERLKVQLAPLRDQPESEDCRHTIAALEQLGEL